jgi:type IV pilus assembly protein PilQ
VAIHDVQVGQVGAQTHVRIEGTAHLEYQALRLSNPERVVLDFAGARLDMNPSSIPGAVRPVSRVRVSQFKPDVARVVIDLKKAVPYSTRVEGNSVTVAFSVANNSSQSAKPVAARETDLPVAQPVAAKMVESPRQPLQPVQENQENSWAVGQPEAPAAPLPRHVGNGQESKPATQAVTETKVEPAVGQPAQVEERQKANPPAAISASVPPQGTVPQAGGQAAAQYAGEPISVNLKDVDLKDFFRLIHEISGLNVVLDPSVKGPLTIVLDEVPWDQALEIVLRNNNLDKQLEGNVLRVATRETLKKEAEIRRDLAKAQAEAIEQVTTTRVLSYAKATGLRDTLKRFLSSRGEILADERANMLIIRDIPSVLPVLDNLIRQLDRKGQQVEIEARVVAASRSFARDIGTQFGFATSAAGGRTIFGGLVGQTGFTSPVIRISPALPVPPLVVSGGGTGTSQIPLNVNLPASVPTSGFTIAHSSPNLALDFIISAAESKGVGKLLSKPKVITQNNEKATVKQGTKIPVQTTINNTISVQFVDAVLKLEVTPQITAEGTVYMEVVVENTQIAEGVPRVQGIPALDTQAVESKVLINDGGTVVIGGIIISRQRTDIQQVPLFGSLPLIGNLFKRTTVNVQSQELLFFLTPRIAPS